ncbi:MAG: NTP transferase domain-containing protein [Anaerolineae bacterium]|nr:NTP transferase domain-containing protein [Anaerolineae bacterium]
MDSLDEIIAIILGGGRGARLFPLTEQRSKPAVPIAGRYRLIDIPISNCINSGLYRIAILTQFNSVSLHRHITNAYQSNLFHFNSGWIQIWAAEQTRDNTDWYQGTADAVRKQVAEIRATRAENILILACDHLYQMDYSQMAQFHRETKADLTVAVNPVSAANASRFGILKQNAAHRIVNFIEKPKDQTALVDFINPNDLLRPFLGSMGIYLFRMEALLDLIADRDLQDFGAHVVPCAIENGNVFGFNFDGYWEDVGTIRSFYEANLMLTHPDPPIDFHDARLPIYTDPSHLACSFVESSSLENVLLAEGCRIKDAYICHSVIGARSQIGSGAEVVDSILMGADDYDNSSDSGMQIEIPLGIGSNSKISGAIIDKNARIGENVVILPFPRGTDFNGDNWMVRDGIVVVPKSSSVKMGSYIGPQNKSHLQAMPKIATDRWRVVSPCYGKPDQVLRRFTSLPVREKRWKSLPRWARSL